MTLAELIARRRGELLAAWVERAGHTRSAEGLSPDELLNSLPAYLDHLVAHLEGDPGRAGRMIAVVEDHVAARLNQGFDLPEVVREYALLAEVVARSWCEGDYRPDPRQTARFYEQLEAATATAIAAFHSHLMDEAQTEKRSIRALDRLAGLEGAAPVLRPRLGEALALIARASAADGAALLLASGPGELELAATQGVLDWAGAGHRTRLDQDPLAARLAALPTPLVLEGPAEAAATLGPLARAPVLAVVGTRLRGGNGLVGLLFLASRSRREFRAWERRRLTALADRLAHLLDAERIHATLASLVERLKQERAIREQFVAILAHDLRGPLAAAGAAAAALARHPARLDARRELAARISASVARADRMVRDLLDANRIRAGERLPLRLEPLDLGELAREVVEELATLHGDRFRLEAEAGVRGVWSASELRRALWNLAVNAIKYGAPGGPVTVAARRAGEEQVALSVHNEGPGLSPEEQGRLFEPFRRLDAAQRSGQVGWGLGLTLVRGCAEAHGGSVSVESAPGQGATFTVRLPLVARVADEQAPAPPA